METTLPHDHVFVPVHFATICLHNVQAGSHLPEKVLGAVSEAFMIT